MRYLILAALTLLSPVVVKAQEWNNACFQGLNDADSPATLPDCESPDMLNVESNLGGTAILKRKGYSLTASLTYSTSAVTGSHSFLDGSGNRLDIVCHDRICSKSTNGNAFTNFLSTAGGTGAVPRRWSFVDVGGILYGANDRRDPILKYDGTTLSYPVGMPNASILALSEDRLIAGDISSQPNRVWFSSAGYYEGFTVGVNPYDSYFDDFGSAGDRIRGIKCVSGNCFIFKSASITLCQLGDQYTTQCSVISPNIGTTDPSSIIATGSEISFRAQDKNYWSITDGGLVQLSKKIPNLVKSQSGGLSGGEQSNTQTSQTDWNSGIQIPTGTWDTFTSAGSIFPSSITISTALFQGTTNLTTITSSTITLKVAFTNSGFQGGLLTGWSTVGTWDVQSLVNCPKLPHARVQSWTMTGNEMRILNASDDSVLTWKAFTPLTSCVNYTIDVSTLVATNIKIRVTDGTNSLTTPSFAKPSGIVTIVGRRSAGTDMYFDAPEPYYSSSGTYLSMIFDTAFTTPTWGPVNVTMSSSSTLGTSIIIRTAVSTSATGVFDTTVTVNNGGKILSAQKRFIRFDYAFGTSDVGYTPYMSSMSFVAATTGTYVTQCIQPNYSIASWGNLYCDQTTAGNGSIVFYATSAATCAALPTTPPTDTTKWGAAITNNATLSIATNTAVYIGWRSLLTSATDQAQVNSCVLNWNEGSPSQPSWAVFDSIKNAIYWTATVNGASSANRLLKYDRNLAQWYPFDIPAAAPISINNSIYFGGASSGTWNLFGGVDSDNSYGINAYWKTKDIGAGRPFVEKNFKTVSILSRNNGSGSMTGTWTLSNSRSGTYSISLSTGTGISYARSNFNIPIASPQQFINVKVGNNNTTPFETLGIGVTWQELPWKVSGP